MPPFQSPHAMIREDLVRIVLAGLIGRDFSQKIAFRRYLPLLPDSMDLIGRLTPPT